MDKKRYDCHNCCYRDKTVNFCGICMHKVLEEFYNKKEESEVLYDGKEYRQQCNQGAEQGV